MSKTEFQSPSADPAVGGYSATVARSVAEVEALRETWGGFRWHPNSDIDHYLAVLGSKKEVVRPHVITLWHQHTAVSMLVGRIEEAPFELKLGYRRLPGPRLRLLRLVYAGHLGHRTSRHCALLVSEVCRSLRSKEADVAAFHFVPVDSLLYQAARTLPPLLCRDPLVKPNSHWGITLAGGYGDYLETLSRATRKHLRNYRNRLEKDFPGRVAFKSFSQGQDLDGAIADIERIARQSYQRGLGVGFADTEEHRQRMAVALSRGWLRVYLLYLDDRPVAFDVGLAYGDTLYLQHGAYDQAYGRYHPGILLLAREIEELCADPGIQRLDFGFGDAEYKKIFGNQSWPEAIIHVFAFRPRALATSLARVLVRGLELAAETTLRRTGLWRWTRRFWNSSKSSSIGLVRGMKKDGRKSGARLWTGAAAP